MAASIVTNSYVSFQIKKYSIYHCYSFDRIINSTRSKRRGVKKFGELLVSIPRKKVNEILTLYKVETQINDVYVEGHGDFIFYTWFCEACNLKIPTIYKIESIEIDVSNLTEHSLANNNRDRLIYLSKKFQEAGLSLTHKPLCIIDRDFDIDLNETDYLSITDYSSHEVYAFTKKTFLNFFRLSLHDVKIDTDLVYSNFCLILKSLYSIRLTNVNLSWSLIWQDFDDFIKIQNGKIILEKEKFIDQYLKENNKKSYKEVFLAELSRVEDKLNKDHIHYVRGHDFVELMLIFIKKNPIRIEQSLRNQNFIKKTILQAIPSDELNGYNQLLRLKTKYKK